LLINGVGAGGGGGRFGSVEFSMSMSVDHPGKHDNDHQGAYYDNLAKRFHFVSMLKEKGGISTALYFT
jgi:hypothetical protein